MFASARHSDRSARQRQDFRPLFDRVERHDRRPGRLLHLTDAHGYFAELERPCPKLRLVRGKADPRFGTRIQLDD